MKYTLLEMSQLVASSMNSDEFTSINDTAESLQIANIIRTCYYDLVGQAHLPEDKTLFNLLETDATSPTKMLLPPTFDSLEWLKYNIEDTDNPGQNWRTLTPLSLRDFLDRIYRLDPNSTEVGSYNIVTGSSTVPVLYSNNVMPQFYTTLDDTVILFDSYDSTEEGFLSALRTQGYGRVIQEFLMSDVFVPPLDEDQFALLLQEAKSLAWVELRQTPNQKAEQAARRHKISQQINKKAVKIYKAFDELPNFGRK